MPGRARAFITVATALAVAVMTQAGCASAGPDRELCEAVADLGSELERYLADPTEDRFDDVTAALEEVTANAEESGDQATRLAAERASAAWEDFTAEAGGEAQDAALRRSLERTVEPLVTIDEECADAYGDRSDLAGPWLGARTASVGLAGIEPAT